MAQGATDGARWEYNSLPNLGTKKSEESIPRRVSEGTGLLAPNKVDQTAAAGVFAESLPPMLRSVMSQLVNSEEQGALFSSISVAEMVSGAFLGLASTAGYRASLSILPGLVFLCYSGLMAFVAVSLGVVSCASKTETNRTENRIHRNWISVSADMYVKSATPQSNSSVHIRLH